MTLMETSLLGVIDKAVGSSLTRSLTALCRRRAYKSAIGRAQELTVSHAADPIAAIRVLRAVRAESGPDVATVMAREFAKVMLLSDAPNLGLLVRLTRETQAVDLSDVSSAVTAEVLQSFLVHFKNSLIDSAHFSELLDNETLRTLRELVELNRSPGLRGEDQYRAQMAKLCEVIEFSGIPEPKLSPTMSLEEFFVPLETEPFRQQARSIEAGYENDSRQHSDSHITVLGRFSPQMDALTLALGSQRLVLLGEPGSGKTTLLRYIANGTALGHPLQGSKTRRLLPIYVPVKDLSLKLATESAGYGLLQYLYDFAQENLVVGLNPGFFESALEDGQAIVLIDGLDEVWRSAERVHVRDSVLALVNAFPKARYIVTSRKEGYERAPLSQDQFEHHVVLPLSKSSITQFVQNWYLHEELDTSKRRQSIEGLLNAIGNRGDLGDFASNPLLLTIICLVYRAEANLPNQRALLYDKCIDTLIRTWDDVKGLREPESLQPLRQHERRLLERLAYGLQSGEAVMGDFRLKEGDLELAIARYITELGLAPDGASAAEPAKRFIELVKLRSGLLVEQAEGEFGFQHGTFREYLAASDIEKRMMPDGIAAVFNEIAPHLMQPEWNQVILFLSGTLARYANGSELLAQRILAIGDEDSFEAVLHRHLYLASRVVHESQAIRGPLADEIIDRLAKVGLDEKRTSKWRQPIDELGDAIEALRSFGSHPHLLLHLKAILEPPVADSWRSRAALKLIGQIGPLREDLTTVLETWATKAATRWLASCAASALVQLGVNQETWLNSLLKMLEAPGYHGWVFTDADEALAAVGRISADQFQRLVKVVNDADRIRSINHTTPQLLHTMTSRFDGGPKAMLELSTNPELDSVVRASATAVIAAIEPAPDWVRTELETLATTPSSPADVTIAALVGLQRRDAWSDGLESVAAMRFANSDEDTDHRIELALLLRKSAIADKARNFLREALADPSLGPHDQAFAAEALAYGYGLETSDADIVWTHIANPGIDDWIRAGFARCFSLDPASAARSVGKLIELVANRREPMSVRTSALHAIASLESLPEATVGTLRAIAIDAGEDDHVRESAYFALKSLVHS